MELMGRWCGSQEVKIEKMTQISSAFASMSDDRSELERLW
jgi:hypothetical protein